jgi:hypothetical protein
MVLRCLSLAAMLIAQPVFAADKPASRQQASNSKDDPNKIICRKYKVTGSLIDTKRVCHTRADWKRLTQEARRTTEDIQDMRGGQNNNN